MSNLNHFNVVTYNIGNPNGNPFSKGYSDHGTARVWKQGYEGVKRNNEVDKSAEKKIEESAAAALLSQQPDVLLLQEMSCKQPDDRGISSSLIDQGYVVSQIVSKDCMIAVNPNRFDAITDMSMSWNKQDKVEYNAVMATDKFTGEKVFFLNLHLAGFNFSDDEDVKNSEVFGREDLRKILEHAKSKAKDCKLQIIGGDFNASPERVASVANNRFKLLESLNFGLIRSNAATNVNPHDKQFQEREIDFQFVKMPTPSWFERIKSFFFGGFGYEKASFEKKDIFGTFANKESYDPELNPSDHLPLFAKYVTYVRPSLPRRVGQFFLSFFRERGRT